MEISDKPAKKTFKVPSSYTILSILIIGLAILTWLIPAGEYQVNDAGQFIAGTYHTVTSNPQSLFDILMSPMYGFVGNERTNGAVEVALFILVIGGFLGVVNKTGALNAGIASAIKNNKGREKRLIFILMILFGLGGSTYGMAEETIAFFPLLIPIMIGMGFDKLVAVAVILVGTQVGALASTVNPFATGVASDVAGISIGDGFVIRVIFLVVLLTISMIWVYRYAARVEQDPTQSVVYDQYQQDQENFKLPEEEIIFTKKQKQVLWIFILTFAVMIVSLIPWSDFNITIFTAINDVLTHLPYAGPLFNHLAALGTWYFLEITMLFMASSLLIAWVYGLSEDDLISSFMVGASNMIGVALICGFSRGIQVIMNDGQITATILHWGEMGLKGLSQQLYILLTYIFYLPMSFLMPGTSSLATATIGLLGPLGEFVGVPAHLVITAFQAASGALNIITPTSGVIMGALAIAKVDITTWWRFVGKLFLLLVVLSAVMLVIASFFV
ncbi:MAG: YfcC family protein [Aerococcus sp.]|nr:YfcC family protein [Aerococcus sp.]